MPLPRNLAIGLFLPGFLFFVPPHGQRSWKPIPLEKAAARTANASLGDLDGDGDLDIVLAKGRHTPEVDVVLLNDGKGTFTSRDLATADRTYTTALADLDGDGDLDIAVGNDEPDEKRIYFNDGKAHFTQTGTFGKPEWPTRNITVVDVNGDRRPDIVVANRGGAQAGAANQLCLNDGHGKFGACQVLSTESATTIAAGDVTGDGAIDLVIPNRDGGQSYVLVNDGRGGFAERRAFGPAKSATRAVALGDLNGDRRLDIIVGDEVGGGALIYFNQPGGFSETVRIADKKDNPYSIALADLDLDGDLDIALGNADTATALLLNDGRGRTFSVTRVGDAAGATYGLAIGDVNGDRSPDLVAARSDAVNVLYLNGLASRSER